MIFSISVASLQHAHQRLRHRLKSKRRKSRPKRQTKTTITHNRTPGGETMSGIRRSLFWLCLYFLLVRRRHAADMTGVVDTILGKYQNAGQAWVGALKNAATWMFWILATISLSWTCISMAIKQAEMGEFFAELCRFIMFTGLFFWLLTNGPEFANDIINSLRTDWGRRRPARERLSTRCT